MATHSEVAFRSVDGKMMITPKGIIQLAISTLRRSEASDEEIAEYADRILSFIVTENNYSVKARSTLGGLVFEKGEQSHNDSQDSSNKLP